MRRPVNRPVGEARPPRASAAPGAPGVALPCRARVRERTNPRRVPSCAGFGVGLRLIQAHLRYAHGALAEQRTGYPRYPKDRGLLSQPRAPRGRHKARLFRELLGAARSDGRWLRDALLDGLQDNEAVAVATDAFGSRWRVDVPVSRHGRSVVVRTVWIVRSGENAPRFVTCWVL